MNSANGYSERIGCLLVGQLRDGYQIERVAMIGVESGESQSDIRQAREAIKSIHREFGLLVSVNNPLDCPLVGAQLADLVSPMAPDEIGGDSEQPRASVALSFVIALPSPEGDSEGL